MASETYQPAPVDFMILERLPDKGLVAGVHWNGKQAKDVRREVVEYLSSNGSSSEFDADKHLPMSYFQGRLRALHVAGFIEGHGSTGMGKPDSRSKGSTIWSRTKAGKDWMGQKERVMGA